MSVQAPATEGQAKHVAVGTSAVRLVPDANLPTGAVRSVEVRALVANTGQVYVGFDSSVTTSGATGGRELSAGESVSMEYANMRDLHAIASAVSQNVAVTVISN